MTWLHFIGKQYYSRAKFIKEAKQYGITRRVSLRDLKKMSYGDTVLLVILEGKSPVIFGSFVIEKISGLSPEASTAVRETFKCELISAGGGVVSRGCGTYFEGPCYAVSASIKEIVGVLEEQITQGIDIGLPMIGGTFKPHPLIRLKNVPFRMGFREFDYDRLLSAISGKATSDKRVVTVRGQFYIRSKDVDNEKPAVEGLEGLIEEVKDYKRKEQVG